MAAPTSTWFDLDELTDSFAIDDSVSMRCADCGNDSDGLLMTPRQNGIDTELLCENCLSERGFAINKNKRGVFPRSNAL